MAEDEMKRTDRRTFLQAGAVATATAMTLAPGAEGQDSPAKADGSAAVLPKRKLGKTGIEVTLLEQGAARGPSADRVLKFAFARGVRLFDTAKVYGTEINFKKWFAQDPAIRKQITLVTKDMPKQPSDFLKMVDQRLEALGTDYIDVFFIHGLGDEPMGIANSLKFIKSPEFKAVADKIRNSGKARFIGFSAHCTQRAQLIQAAAEGGVIDAIMLQYRPWLEKDSALNKALDAAWNKGIGLISMKQIASQSFGDRPKGDVLKEVELRVPVVAEKKLTPFQGLLHAIWTDERISAACVSMRNTEQIRENAEAAARFEPLKTAEIHQLRDAFRAHGPTLCADCEGQCALAAGTQAELGNLTRFLTYYKKLGDRAEARRQYAMLSAEARDWSGADLEAARAACPDGLDFAALLPEVDEHLA
jgi:predicted aldo/keto reductase-like oxidoreductase